MNIHTIKKIFVWFFTGVYLFTGLGLSSYASCLKHQCSKVECCCCKHEMNHNNSISGTSGCNCVKDKAPSQNDNTLAVFQQKSINLDKLCCVYVFSPLLLDFQDNISPEIVSKSDIVPNVNLNMLKTVILLT